VPAILRIRLKRRDEIEEAKKKEEGGWKSEVENPRKESSIGDAELLADDFRR